MFKQFGSVFIFFKKTHTHNPANAGQAAALMYNHLHREFPFGIALSIAPAGCQPVTTKKIF